MWQGPVTEMAYHRRAIESFKGEISENAVFWSQPIIYIDQESDNFNPSKVNKTSCFCDQTKVIKRCDSEEAKLEAEKTLAS